MTNVHPEPAQSDLLRAGRAALARGAWEEARDCFAEELSRAQTPEALEGLGLAAWWLDDGATTFEAREHAYRLYRERGDRAGAARIATWSPGTTAPSAAKRRSPPAGSRAPIACWRGWSPVRSRRGWRCTNRPARSLAGAIPPPVERSPPARSRSAAR